MNIMYPLKIKPILVIKNIAIKKSEFVTTTI